MGRGTFAASAPQASRGTRHVGPRALDGYIESAAAVCAFDIGPAPRCIAMGSVAGGAGHAFRAPYMSTEWAIVGLVKSLAVELGPAGIRVNAILQRALAASSRRPAAADGVAALALFLCSPAARNLTGQAISIDGNAEWVPE